MDLKTIIKSMGRFFWIPIAINDFVIPLIILFISINSSAYNLNTGIIMLTQMFTPFLVVFWIYLHLIKYIDAKGNENFFVLERNKLKEVIKLTLLYIVSNTPFFIWYIWINKAFIYEYVHIVIMCTFFAMGAYFFSFLLRSISLGIIPSFIYTLASITELNPTLNKISYFEITGMHPEQLLTKYIYFLAVAILFAILGKILNNHYTNYNT